MKIIKDFNFVMNNLEESGLLNVVSENDEIVNYESFILENPITQSWFPEFDEPYYTHLEYTLRHLLYKYEKGWITSNRQVMYSSDECISTVHFVFDDNNKVTNINVFQRSSNVNNIVEDMQFFNYFISVHLGYEVDLTVFVSIPHKFKNKKTKVD